MLFLFSVFGVASGCGSSAVSASLSRSTMAASVVSCFLASGARRSPPSVAVVLSTLERRDVASDSTDFLRRKRQNEHTHDLTLRKERQ